MIEYKLKIRGIRIDEFEELSEIKESDISIETDNNSYIILSSTNLDTIIHYYDIFNDMEMGLELGIQELLISIHIKEIFNSDDLDVSKEYAILNNLNFEYIGSEGTMIFSTTDGSYSKLKKIEELFTN